MYATRLNESNYTAGTIVKRLKGFYINQRVIFSGRTNYSYGEKELHLIASKQYGTVVGKTDNNVVVMLDDYKNVYRDNKGADVIPPKQYAVVTECDLACGCKTLESLY